MKTNQDESKLRREFEAIKEELEKWGCYVDLILNEYIKETFNIAEHIQSKASHRIKNIDSYCQKVLLRDKDYDNPLLDVTDKVATRVICLSTDDVNKVSSFIENCKKWDLHEIAQNISESITKNPEIFTYRSNHYIVKPNDSYITNEDKKLLTCEIQVRTLLQHAYAELSHEMFYKKSVEENNSAKHMLASSMAFIEAADEKFVQIYDSVQNDKTNALEFRNFIIQLYKKFCPSYDENEYSEEISQKILKIYTQDDLSEIKSNISNFLLDPKNSIKIIFNKYRDKYILLKQPYVLILFYGIRMYQNQTVTNWPFVYDSLKYIAQLMGISEEALR